MHACTSSSLVEIKMKLHGQTRGLKEWFVPGAMPRLRSILPPTYQSFFKNAARNGVAKAITIYPTLEAHDKRQEEECDHREYRKY